jgi:signal transduction histidine kinase
MQSADPGLELAHAGIATADFAGTRIWIRFDPLQATLLGCSATMAEGLGYATADWRGQSLRLLADAGDWDDPQGAWRALLGGQELCDQPLRVLARDGTCRLMSASATMLHAADEGPATGLLILDELGRRWQREAARQRDRRRLQTLAYEVTLAEARERERLANDLHDELGQLLAIAQFRLGELATTGGSNAAFDELRELLTQAAQATRSATFDLHSPLLQQLGLQAAIESLGERLARQARLSVEVRGQFAQVPLNAAVQAVLLRVVRELLANVQKHASARTVTIELRRDERRLGITVRDDGRGFDAAARRHTFSRDGGFGLVSAEAQMQAIGGRLELHSAHGAGTTAILTIELPRTGSRRTH